MHRRGLPYGSGLVSRCRGPGECLHSFIHRTWRWMAGWWAQPQAGCQSIPVAARPPSASRLLNRVWSEPGCTCQAQSPAPISFCVCGWGTGRWCPQACGPWTSGLGPWIQATLIWIRALTWTEVCGRRRPRRGLLRPGPMCQTAGYPGMRSVRRPLALRRVRLHWTAGVSPTRGRPARACPPPHVATSP